MHTRNIAVTLLAVALAAACERGSPNLVGPEVRASKSAAPKMVPFKATLTYQSTAPAQVDRCGPEEIGMSLTKAGNATHLGRFAAVASQCLDPATGTIAKGEAIFTAANGNQVFARHSGQVTGSPPVLAFEIHYTITGGTGRFAGASGSINAIGDFDVRTGGGSASLEGVISSPARGRR
jgi:hypothetical protein